MGDLQDMYSAPTLMEDILESAGIGGWELEIATMKISWTNLTRAIHEVAPGYEPDLADALTFYPPGVVPIIEQAMQLAISEGTPWSLEVPFVTAAGRQLQIRCTGRAVRTGAKITRLVGAFQDITRTYLAALEMERLGLVVQQMTNAIVITDVDGRTEWVNDGFCKLTGYSEAELVGHKPGGILQGPATDKQTVADMHLAIQNGLGFDVEIINYTRNGEPYWISVTCTPLLGAMGSHTGFIAVESDVTARRQAEFAIATEINQRKAADILLRDVLDTLPDGVMAFDGDEKLVLANAAHRALFPILANIMQPGRSLEEVVTYALLHGQYADAGETSAERQVWLTDYLASLRNPGESTKMRLPGDIYVEARERRSASGNLVCVRTDITRLQAAEAAIRRQAERDSLTDLVNRNVLTTQLDGALNGRRAGDCRGGALVLIDVDHFKTVNDVFGHDGGDALLVAISQRLQLGTRKTDTVARLGGDEFALLLPATRAMADPAREFGALLTRLLAALTQTVVIAGKPVTPSLSMGMAIYPQDGADAQALLKCADLALYEAKRHGRCQWRIFDREQVRLASHRDRVAADLRTAIEMENLHPEFQPKIRLRDGSHAGFEALARWTHHGHAIMPNEFIPIAEETGLILPLGRCILKQTLAAMRELIDSGLAPGPVAINVAALELASAGFADNVADALDTFHVRPEMLEIEITETVLLDRAASRIEQSLTELRQIGLRLALDDFGTGYASLTHLRRFPIQRLKIDRSFIRGIGIRSDDETIIKTIISLAHGLGMDVIGEGIETQSQLEFLRRHGCDEAQGYLIARPLSLADAALYLVGNKRQKEAKKEAVLF